MEAPDNGAGRFVWEAHEPGSSSTPYTSADAAVSFVLRPVESWTHRLRQVLSLREPDLWNEFVSKVPDLPTQISYAAVFAPAAEACRHSESCGINVDEYGRPLWIQGYPEIRAVLDRLLAFFQARLDNRVRAALRSGGAAEAAALCDALAERFRLRYTEPPRSNGVPWIDLPTPIPPEMWEEDYEVPKGETVPDGALAYGGLGATYHIYRARKGLNGYQDEGWDRFVSAIDDAKARAYEDADELGERFRGGEEPDGSGAVTVADADRDASVPVASIYNLPIPEGPGWGSLGGVPIEFNPSLGEPWYHPDDDEPLFTLGTLPVASEEKREASGAPQGQTEREPAAPEVGVPYYTDDPEHCNLDGCVPLGEMADGYQLYLDPADNTVGRAGPDSPIWIDALRRPEPTKPPDVGGYFASEYADELRKAYEADPERIRARGRSAFKALRDAAELSDAQLRTVKRQLGYEGLPKDEKGFGTFLRLLLGREPE